MACKKIWKRRIEEQQGMYVTTNYYCKQRAWMTQRHRCKSKKKMDMPVKASQSDSKVNCEMYGYKLEG